MLIVTQSRASHQMAARLVDLAGLQNCSLHVDGDNTVIRRGDIVLVTVKQTGLSFQLYFSNGGFIDTPVLNDSRSWEATADAVKRYLASLGLVRYQEAEPKGDGMTDEKVIEVFREYVRLLTAKGCKSEPRDHSLPFNPNDPSVANHLLWMANQAQTFLPHKKEKAMRWLGFIQGCFFVLGWETIDSLKNANKP